MGAEIICRCYRGFSGRAPRRSPFVMPSAGDEIQNLLSERNDQTACYSQHTVGSLAGIVALEAETQLKDSEAQQDHAVSPDQGEDEVGQIVHRRQRVAGGESRDEKDGE